MYAIKHSLDGAKRVCLQRVKDSDMLLKISNRSLVKDDWKPARELVDILPPAPLKLRPYGGIQI